MEISKSYQFDEDHPKLLYKRLKGLRFPKEKFDRIPYILFKFIFDHNIINQIRMRATLFEIAMELFKMHEYIPHELFINTAHLIYHDFKEIDYTRLIPSILRGFYEEKLLDEVGGRTELTSDRPRRVGGRPASEALQAALYLQRRLQQATHRRLEAAARVEQAEGRGELRRRGPKRRREFFRR